MINQEKIQQYIKILKEELVPAMGCTEPISLAYAAAKARQVLGETPISAFVINTTPKEIINKPRKHTAYLLIQFKIFWISLHWNFLYFSHF